MTSSAIKTSAGDHDQEMLSRLDRVISTRKSSEKREMKVSEARPIIEDMVSERIISEEMVRRFFTALYIA